MKWLKKRRLIHDLKNLLSKADSFELFYFLSPHETIRSDDFVKWLQRVKETLSTAFGKASEQRRTFDELALDAEADVYPDGSGNHLVRAKAILSGCIHRLERYGLDEPEVSEREQEEELLSAVRSRATKAPKWISKATRKFLLPVLIGVLTLILGQLLLKCFEDSEEYKQVGVSFYNWMEDYDRTLWPGFEKLRVGAAHRGVYDSGPTAEAAIEYFQEFRRNRDNIIDSLLVAYSLAGGDTTTLEYRRKLPCNAREIILDGWGDIDEAVTREINRMLLDTL